MVIGVLVAFVTAWQWGGSAPAGAATALAVDAGYAGSYTAGRRVPVRVTVATDRAVRGRLRLRVIGGASVAIPVQLPAGGRTELFASVPTANNTSGWTAGISTTRVDATLDEGSFPLASGRSPTLTASPTQEVVGLLPGVLAGRPLPGTAALAVDSGTAVFVSVGPDDLARAPSSLGPVSTVGMGATELAGLAPAARKGLLAWVEGGGHLLIDANAGTVAVPGLPEAWQPGLAGRARAGSGEVRLTGGAMATGSWAGLVEPTDWAVAVNPGETFDSGYLASPLGGSLAAEAGLRVPRIAWLVAFLASYVVLVGPVLFLVLKKRHRPELAWVAIPVVALVFTTGSYVGGRNLRRSAHVVQASVITTGVVGNTTTTFVGVFSPKARTARLGFPDGWSADGSPAGGWSSGAYGFPPPALVQAEVELTPRGPQAVLPLDTGQFALVSGSGPSDTAGGLELAAGSAADGRASGVVRNRTGFDLDEVAVFVGLTATRIGRLGRGEEKEWSASTRSADQFGPPIELQVWNASQGLDEESPVSLSLWQAAKTMVGPIGPSTAVAAGWTRRYTPPVRVDGGSPPLMGRTVVIGQAPVPPTGPRITDINVRREIVRRGIIQQTLRTGRFEPTEALTVRFVLPPGGSAVALALRSTARQAEAWDGSVWKPITCEPQCATPPIPALCPPGTKCPGPFPGEAPSVATEITLPPEATSSGVVNVRLERTATGPQSLMPLAVHEVEP